MTAGASCGCRKLGSACDLVFRGALSAGGMGVIYDVLPGLLVLRSRRDRLPFGEAEQARGQRDKCEAGDNPTRTG